MVSERQRDNCNGLLKIAEDPWLSQAAEMLQAGGRQLVPVPGRDCAQDRKAGLWALKVSGSWR